MIDQVAEQLADELQSRWSPLATLGVTRVIDPRQVPLIDEGIAPLARMLAAQLVQDEDDRLAAQTVIDVMCALWPETEPPVEWWRTPLGRMVARSIGSDDADAVTHSVAAAMLGIPRGSVGTLVHRGQLDRHPDGGVTRASVFARLAR